jgi:hypothetical protein
MVTILSLLSLPLTVSIIPQCEAINPYKQQLQDLQLFPAVVVRAQPV